MIKRHESTLDNGLRVVVAELPHLHTATVALYIKVGSRFEVPEDNGLSHFVEHMLFRGSQRHQSSYELNFAIERLGATLYAETGRDCGLFQLSLEPDSLDAGLEILGALLSSPRFSEIELERELVLEELKEDYDEKDVEINADDIARGLLFGDHALGQRIVGPKANVDRFDIDDVRRHFQRFYCGANMLLCIAGPVDPTAVTELARDRLGALPAGALIETVAPEFDQSAAQYVHIDDPGSQSAISLLLRAVPELDPDYPALTALMRVLDDGMSTRLHYRLCDQLGLAYSINASLEPLHDITLVDVSANTGHEKVAPLLRELLKLLSEFRDEPISAAELDKVQRRYRYDLLASIDEPNAVAAQLGGIALYYEPPSLDEKIARMQAITVDDVQRVARRIIRPQSLTVAVVGTLSQDRAAEVRAAVLDWR